MALALAKMTSSATGVRKASTSWAAEQKETNCAAVTDAAPMPADALPLARRNASCCAHAHTHTTWVRVSCERRSVASAR